jgi:hypothetical protein
VGGLNYRQVTLFGDVVGRDKEVGYTGTRQGMSAAQLLRLPIELHRAGATALHHGDCRGGDEQAHVIGRSLGLWIKGHPPKASGLRAFCICDELAIPKPFLIRNQAIVLETRLLIATPVGPEILRSGTWSTVRFARRHSLPWVVIAPDGTTYRSEIAA